MFPSSWRDAIYPVLAIATAQLIPAPDKKRRQAYVIPFAKECLVPQHLKREFDSIAVDGRNISKQCAKSRAGSRALFIDLVTILMHDSRSLFLMEGLGKTF